MTTIGVTKRRPGPRPAKRPAGRGGLPPKPATADDVDRLHELARRLDGRPVPGVRMTEDQFDRWCDEDVKAEWVDGEVILMSPENEEHIDWAQWFLRVLAEFVEHHDLGRVIGREFQVRLPRQRRRRSPDVLFVARGRLGLVRHTFLEGAPDLAIEIVSPDSQSRDWRDKYGEYERAGVREYWVFDPMSRRFEAYALGSGRPKRFAPVPEQDGRIASSVLPGFHLRLSWFQQSRPPRGTTVLAELGLR